MSKKRDDLKQIVNEALANETYTLYSLDWGKKGPDWKLEVYLDKPGGISTKECVNFSHKLSEILDEIDIIDRSYQLEVSSPGVERTLEAPRHFKSAIDSRVQIKTYYPVKDKKIHTGILKDFQEEEENARLLLSIKGEKTDIALSDVAHAQTKPKLEM